MKRIEKMVEQLVHDYPAELVKAISVLDLTIDTNGKFTKCKSCIECLGCRFTDNYGSCMENMFKYLMEEIDDNEGDNN